MLHPNQFQVNEAWIAFQLNAAPMSTERDGTFNCLCLMDAASCFMLGTECYPADELEPSPAIVRRLLEAGWKQKREFPLTLFVPAGQFPTSLPAEAQRQGITVVSTQESQLLVFISDARQAFEEYFER